ncbi:hypothetical protein MmTuc01_1276 [Methanosarcina mazei Tuc01]|uniref:Uncharacterized protein n=1 Tax=Methanosarcina mazei Tuc01 TaxID=1236903 RepID=M1P889_METMZ|nr:hypothetical protein MmTuc01_1276 [Methanosarcina mazei Tuc01]
MVFLFIHKTIYGCLKKEKLNIGSFFLFAIVFSLPSATIPKL